MLKNTREAEGLQLCYIQPVVDQQSYNKGKGILAALWRNPKTNTIDNNYFEVSREKLKIDWRNQRFSYESTDETETVSHQCNMNLIEDIPVHGWNGGRAIIHSLIFVQPHKLKQRDTGNMETEDEKTKPNNDLEEDDADESTESEDQMNQDDNHNYNRNRNHNHNRNDNHSRYKPMVHNRYRERMRKMQQKHKSHIKLMQ